jgi:hypothetical protein
MSATPKCLANFFVLDYYILQKLVLVTSKFETVLQNFVNCQFWYTYFPHSMSFLFSWTTRE